jgi:hypothetical protein
VNGDLYISGAASPSGQAPTEKEEAYLRRIVTSHKGPKDRNEWINGKQYWDESKQPLWRHSEMVDRVRDFAFAFETCEGFPCVTLISPCILKAFDVCVKTYIGVTRRRTSIVVAEPYTPLYRNLAQIGEYVKQHGCEREQFDFEALNWFMGKLRDTYDDVRYTLDERKEVVFYNLWALFEVGDALCLKDEFGEWRVWRFFDLTYGRPEDDMGKIHYSRINHWKTSMLVRAWCIAWNPTNKQFEREAWSFRIPYFTGVRPITSLAVFTLRYLEEVEEIRKDLIDRGRQWKEIVSGTPKCWEHDGGAIKTDPSLRKPPSPLPHPPTQSTKEIEQVCLVYRLEKHYLIF